MNPKPKIKTIKKKDEVKGYIQNFPKQVQKRLLLIRSTIKKIAPKVTEKISYGIPGYDLNGPLVYFAAYKKHIGFYPTASGISKFEKELSKYKYARGSVQFPHDQELPISLISKIVKFRVRENGKIKRQ